MRRYGRRWSFPAAALDLSDKFRLQSGLPVRRQRESIWGESPNAILLQLRNRFAKPVFQVDQWRPNESIRERHQNSVGWSAS